MQNWFEVKVKYQQNIDAVIKSITEHYLFDGISYTEVEARATLAFVDMLECEFVVKNIKQTNYTDIIAGDSDIWYKCCVKFVMIDEDSGKEKKVNNYFLINADSIIVASNILFEELKDMIVPFELYSVTETKIVGVFPYVSDILEFKDPTAGKTVRGESPLVHALSSLTDSTKEPTEKETNMLKSMGMLSDNQSDAIQ